MQPLTCRRCGRPVLFCRSLSGIVVLDAKPDERGQVAIVDGLAMPRSMAWLVAVWSGSWYGQHECDREEPNGKA